MSTKQYYHNIDLVKVGQLVNARKHNLTTTEREALAATLSVDNEGLFVWDTTLKAGFTWSGTEFLADAINLEGDVVFKGLIDASVALDDPGQPQVVTAKSGYEYVVSVAGTLTLTGVTFSPNAVVEVGDRVLFTSATQAYVQQRNDAEATEAALGNVRLASQAEVTAGTQATEAVTPATLGGALVANKYVKQYFGSVNVPAGATGVNVAHGLSLNDAAAFQVNTVDASGNQVSLEVDTVDANTLRLRSLVALTGIKVTVQGASTAYVGV